MKWVGRSLRNSLAIYLLSFALCLGGLFCLTVIPVTPYPFPPAQGMRMMFHYPGANAHTMQTQVVSKVVSGLQAVPNIQSIDTMAGDGMASMQITLNDNTPLAVLQTQMQLQRVVADSHLPRAVPPPRIERGSGYAELVTYMVMADHLSLFQIDNFIEAKLVPVFRSIPGVILDKHGQDPIISIALQPMQLAAYHLLPSSVAETVNDAMGSQPLGQLYLGGEPYALNLGQPISRLPQMAQIILGYHGQGGGGELLAGQPIRLSDVATVAFQSNKLGAVFYNSYNGHLADGIDLNTSTAANPFDVMRITHAFIEKIKDTLPADMKIFDVGNQATSMHQSFNEVLFTVGIASLLVLGISLMFLGRLRLTLVPIVTIPICLLGAIAIITAFGLSLNILTLLAMVIAVGLVVDDAIVVMENIMRHVEAGMGRQQAVWQGTTEIAKTVIGITATLLAVYLPLSFVKHSVFIQMLSAFAMPLAAAVLISGVLALTLTPVMCAHLLDDSPQNAYQVAFNRGLTRVILLYQWALKRVLDWPVFFIGLFVLCITVGVYADMHLPRRFFPHDPTGNVEIIITATPQDNVDTLKAKAARFASFYQAPQVNYRALEIRNDQRDGRLKARLEIHYKDSVLTDVPKFSQQVTAFVAKHQLQQTNVKMNLEMNSGNWDYDVVGELYGDVSLAALNKKAQALTDQMKKSSLLSLADNRIPSLQKQFTFDIDTVQAARFGLARSNIATMLGVYYGGQTLDDEFDIAGLSVPVMVQLGASDLQNPNLLSQLQIKSPQTNRYYPLSQFVHLKMVALPSMLETFNNHPSVMLLGKLAPGVSMSAGIKYLNQLVATQAPDLSLRYDGPSKQYLEGNAQTILVGVLGIICIYMLLAILFQSLLDPLIILLTVPFSMVGGALSLYAVGGSLNLFSTLALITLIGLITKHGVLLVQFANHMLSKGSSVREAVLMATHDRFRPIMMTTLAMSLGALPLLWSEGHMYVSRHALAAVLIGGLLIGTLFSLFIVPLVYTLVKKAPKSPLSPSQD